ncbi:YphA family membrane protein [Bacillus piscicola]|uniref:YphA family membrane protein n=1 Tax=Bacillus piscicola TaxID=1632684 RepID=UPI003B839338
MSCWVLWIIQTFLVSRRHSWRLVTSAILLLIIWSLPAEWEFGPILIKPVFIILLLGGFGTACTLSKTRRIRMLTLAGGFAFLFAALRMAEWYEPVIFLFGPLLTYVVCFLLLHILVMRTFIERLASVLIASCSGEIIYQAHMYDFTSSMLFGQTLYLQYMFLMIMMLYAFDWLCRPLSVKKRNPVFSRFNLPGS